MTSPISSRSLATLGAAALILCTLTPAQATANPPIQMAPQGVEYMCGGQRGAEELAFMEKVSPRWGATLEFAVNGAPRGKFAAPVQISMRNKYNGEHVLQAKADGPLMVARLAPGTYEVQATLGTLTLTQEVVVRLGQPGRTLFLWPSNFDIASATMPRQTLAQGR
ncbi:hypothetical protein PGB34_22540 [Xenophilus arseniciresistens]|uniref:Carboxypeptidase regulatory-like domain-containing protein n=1 Tax=Xenophilus arseniciresistens TaxID=1283306 RepID=A0AAE3NCJ0_9BURK|nr:hypothetical protein [Xenophilus arseniciresistens]MDA7419161.1 hypothetical protein [Xenophilus arseniciresistens]